MANRRRRRLDDLQVQISIETADTIVAVEEGPVVPVPVLSAPEEAPGQTGLLVYIAGTATEKLIDAMVDEPKNWLPAKNGSLRYGDLSGTYISIGNPAATTEIKDAYAKLLALGDEVAQTLLFMMAKCLSNEDPTQKVRFHVNSALEFRGFKRHKNRDFRAPLKRAEANRFALLSEIWVKAVDTIEIRKGRGKRPRRINITSRLIEFAAESEESVSSSESSALSTFLDPDSTEVPFAFRVGLGEWVKHYLQTGNLQMRQMLNKIGRYDVSSDTGRFAMRIGLSFVMRGVEQVETVESILRNARIPIPQRHRGEFKSHIEDAFESLKRDGLIGGWSYVESPDLSETRWFSNWLAWKISFVAPAHPFSGKLSLSQ